jgi:Transposase DDE domain
VADAHRTTLSHPGRSIDPCGFDAGKKIKGKKRHILVDTEGLLMQAIVHPADVQDRDGGVLLVSILFGLYPFFRKVFADGGYRGPVFEQAAATFLAMSRSRSSNARTSPRGPSFFRAAGSSSAPSPGSIAVAVSPRISKIGPATRWPSCNLPPSDS